MFKAARAEVFGAGHVFVVIDLDRLGSPPIPERELSAQGEDSVLPGGRGWRETIASTSDCGSEMGQRLIRLPECQIRFAELTGSIDDHRVRLADRADPAFHD